MRTQRCGLLALLGCLMLLISVAPASAQVPLHATTITSASGFWILGPAGEARVRYATAGFYEKNQDGKIETLAYAFIGTCKERSGDLFKCRTERSVSDEDFRPSFFMDPSMQVATLELGPHRVQWNAMRHAPWVTFYGVSCDPDDEESSGPNLSRAAVAEGHLFGQTMSTEAHPMSYGHLSRGAILSECAFRAHQTLLQRS